MLSVVVPTLNEADDLPRTLAALREAAAGPFELIVADCGSVDATADLAASLGATVVTGARHRADALNRGAAAAGGDTLLFLHADTRLPDGFDAKIRRSVARGAVGGCFEFGFGSHPDARGLNRHLLRYVVLANRARHRHSGRAYGDQALFCRRSVFHHLGGYEDLPLMEDGRFARRLRLAGPTAVLQPPARTSPRRFVEGGRFRVLRTALTDLWLMTCDDLGVVPRRAWERYNAVNAARGQDGGSFSDQSYPCDPTSCASCSTDPSGANRRTASNSPAPSGAASRKSPL